MRNDDRAVASDLIAVIPTYFCEEDVDSSSQRPPRAARHVGVCRGGHCLWRRAGRVRCGGAGA